MTDVTIKIGKNLREMMATSNHTLKQISKATGVPVSTLAEWSNNRSPKNLVHAQRVASFLGVSLHFLLFGEEDQQEPLVKLMKEDVFSGTFEINIKRVRVR